MEKKLAPRGEASLALNGRQVAIGDATNLLELARREGVYIPSFCYHSHLSVYGACRLCLVEVEGMGMVTSCTTSPRPDMVVRTMTDRLRQVRRHIVELMLAGHDRECTTCSKSGSCKLQQLAQDMGIEEVPGEHMPPPRRVDTSSPAIVRNMSKCVLCGDCVRVCREIQGIGVLDFAHRGPRMQVGPAFDKDLAEVDCVNCGQCCAVCPTGALSVRNHVDEVWRAINDPDSIVVVQLAPAVRVALAEEFGALTGEDQTGRIVAALRRVGFDHVFDTALAADLTAIEETHELMERMSQQGALPLFTSCCPAWVQYAEQYHPDLLPHLSTCRSPQQMFGALAKTYFAEKQGYDAKRIFVVSVMPCTAKKSEARRDEFSTDDVADVDVVVSTVEMARMIREAGLQLGELEPEAVDMPLGLATGAGVIFGATGGVTEAVLRTVAGLKGEASIHPDFEKVRGMEGVKEAEINIGGTPIRAAVVSGLKAAEALVQRIKAKQADYDVVEVMACPGGCVGGGGQPTSSVSGQAKRAKGLYRLDKQLQLRSPLDNPAVEKLYREWLGETGGPRAHQLLHTQYAPRRRIRGRSIRGILQGDEKKAVDVAVCVGTGCYLRGAYNVMERLVEESDRHGLTGRVNLSATFCLEQCDNGVAMMVDGKVIGGVTPDNVWDVLQEQLGTADRQ